MAENVQCPVCTLFLHAGMNLSDHLETHPKEQVIKALVQLTISGGSGAASGVLKAVLSTDSNKAKEVDNSTANRNENDISRSNSRLSTISSSSTLCSTISSLNSAASYSIHATLQTQERSSDSSTITSPIHASEGRGTDVVNASYDQHAVDAMQSYQNRNTSNLNELPLLHKCMKTTNLNKFHQQHHQQGNQEQHIQPQGKPQPITSISSQLQSPNNQYSLTTATKQTNNPQLQQQQQQKNRTTTCQSLIANPPLIPSQYQHQHQHHLMSMQHHHSASAETAASTSTFAVNEHQFSKTANATQRHQHLQQHQQQNLKIQHSNGIALPPLPPLQQTANPQHQKPPPAYGTAISQIRSQQNQTKHQSATILSQHPYPQAQQQRHTAASSNPPRIVSHTSMQQITPAISTFPTTTPSSIVKYAVHERSQSSSVEVHHGIGYPKQQSGMAKSQQHFHHHQYEYHRQQDFRGNSKTNDGAIVSNSRENMTNQQNEIELSEKFSPPPPQPQNVANSKSSTVTSHSSPTLNVSYSQANSSLSRQTNSPFTSLLAAPSPSSVLRYAESPVAHYLERDNGDFIVQETPKHIVECVEEEDGEFSVTERFYQSPPSVLHIHEDNDDDEDESTSSPESTQKDADLKDICSDKNEHPEEEALDLKAVGNNNDVNPRKTDKKSAKNDQACPSSTESLGNSAKSCNDANTTTASNSASLDGITKKSSKNTITVLSDVQLNLNEYLDLVGNIIASSKIAKRRTMHTAAAPLPLVKVEKIEVSDDEYGVEGNLLSASKINASENSESATLNEPASPQKTADKEETEQERLIENISKATSDTENSVKSEDMEFSEIADATSNDCKEYISEVPTAPPVASVPCSSHVTSVIRMATTANAMSVSKQAENLHTTFTNFNFENAHQQQEVATAINSCEGNNVAQDLTQSQKANKEISNETNASGSGESFIYGLPPPPPLKKGPKKLVIKPKSSKTDENAKKLEVSASNRTSDEEPSTSSMARKSQMQTQEVMIKCEPTFYETNKINCINAPGLMEQSLQLNLERELTSNPDKLPSQNAHEISVAKQECKSIKTEPESFQNKDNSKDAAKSNSVNQDKTCAAAEDARVLLDFANSTKRVAENVNSSVGSATFFSPNSLFSNSAAALSANERLSKYEIDTKSNNNTDEMGSAKDTLRCEDEFIGIDEHDVEEMITSSYSQSATTVSSKHQNNPSNSQYEQQQLQQPTSFEYPFGLFYNNVSGTDSAPKISTHNQFSPVYQQATDATTAATVASSGTLDTLDDSASTPTEPGTLENRFGAGHSNLPQWYQTSATLVANSNFEAALAIDNAAVDGDVGKYLDLDACKRENLGMGVQMAPSSTLSSFAAATESSLAGGCTNDTLNIRTDEKMPPKGEISEQESNCDIDNSWSQPVYGEIQPRFYRTSFPTIFQHENGWSHEEFFTVQDLSPSANGPSAAHVSSKNNNKSFDFHLPMETTAAGPPPPPMSFSSNNFHILTGDDQPSTSLSGKKKRKRDLADVGNKTDNHRAQPTATITSQQLMQSDQSPMQDINTAQSNDQPKPSTSSTGTTSVASTSQPRPRRKVYQCPHCNMEFAKLRDRNSHMIDIHDYVRQNRRLISSQSAASAVIATSSLLSSSMEGSTVVAANDTLLTFGSNAIGSSTNLSQNAEEGLADSKQNIKIKMEFEQQLITSNNQNCEQSLPLLGEGVNTKSEIIEEQNVRNSVVDAGSAQDIKPNVQQSFPLAAPTTKLATLYRMLVSFNVATLKQNQNLSALEEKLIESSIFFCYTCHTNFSSVKFYDAHLTEHPAECFTCGKKFQRWKNFSLHLKRHLGWKEFACNVCDKKFVVRSALVEHTRMHTGHTPLKCKICGKSFKRYSNLTQHRKRHGRVYVRKKEYVCHCGEVLPSKARFLWHKETHDSKPKCCPHCCDRFVHANSLRRHIRLAHSDKFDYAEPMECPMCKQVFAKSSIKAHMATHSMDTQHDCNICNKSFSTKWNLKIHLWVHANRTAKPFKCEHCPKAFVREVDFKNHMNAHKQIKPYTCEYCGCKFIRKYNYMRHRREHHGNKKFTCDLCKKSFHRHYYLIEHRRIHTGERPFQCTICGKSSTTKTNHNKHLKIHHSRDPFTVET